MIDKDKQYRTRDGREVRIYAVDGREGEEVHGAFLSKGGWVSNSWAANGLWCAGGEDACDLIEVKPRIQREVWLNVYPDVAECLYYTTKQRADESAVPQRIACVKLTIDCEEVEGL